ncbi:MAG: hypothetical protein AAFQ98_20515 [Bacteroidota bacterium]
MLRLVFLALWVGAHILPGYGQVPHISGTIEVSISKKSIECELSYSNLPEQYAIRLNKLFVRPDFRDGNGNELEAAKEDSHNTYESQGYSLISGNQPRQFQADYQVRLPLRNRFRNKVSDWKGNLAFNRYSLRASEQTEWYPVVIDKETGLVINEFSYDLQITCEDCTSLYINGSPPVAASTGEFKANTPYQLMLYVGDYSFTKSGSVYFLNSPLSPEQEEFFRAQIDTVTAYYARKLEIPYGKEFVLIQTTPTARHKAWQFNTYPAIVTIGYEPYTMARMFRKPGSRGVRPGSLATTYHETAHFYFGVSWVPVGPLRWAFLEGFNEYVALQACRDLMGPDQEYERRLAWYGDVVKDKDFTPLHEVSEVSQIGSTYRYRYVPLLLSAIESEIGREASWAWLQTILASEATEVADYPFFRNTLLESGVPEEVVVSLEERFIFSPSAKENVLDALGLTVAEQE